MCSYTTFTAKVVLCAHTYGKIGIFTAEYIPPTFWLVHPLPLLRRLTVGAAIEKNFLFFSVTSFLFGFVLDFIQNICRFNSLQVFSRYSSRLYSLDIISITIFDSHQFRLVSALSILLFDSSACYKQTFMLIWVWFMLVLAILRLSDVFLFVLGVVYRLWLK